MRVFFGQFPLQPISVCNVHGLQFLELKQRRLCGRRIEAKSLQGRDVFTLLGDMHFGLRDVAEGERQMVQERGPVHARSLPHTNSPHILRSRKADRADSPEPVELGWDLPGAYRVGSGPTSAENGFQGLRARGTAPTLTAAIRSLKLGK
jgi:hypothetical protein